MPIKVTGTSRRQNARPFPGHLIAEMHRQVDDLLEAELILNYPICRWVAPCHLVPKPRSTKWRLVIDYRYINSLMEEDGYQIPRINKILRTLKVATWFTVIDLNWGFWNVTIVSSTQALQYLEEEHTYGK